MNDISYALVASVFITIVLSSIQIFSDTKIKEVKPHLTIQLFFYVFVMAIGNIITTLTASSFIDDLIAEKQNSFFSRGPVWLWYSFIGVFGFEIIIQRINISIFDKGLLTVSDWITKAKNTSVSATLERASELNLMEKQQLANRYYSSFANKSEIHAAAVAYLGEEKYQKIVDSANKNTALTIELHLAYVMANEVPMVVKGALKTIP